MKAISFLRITACAALFFFSASLQAQLPTATVEVAKTSSATDLDKTAIAPTTTSKDERTLDGLKLRNEKLYRHFKNNFKDASEISVYPHPKTTVVYCLVNGIRNNILYNNKGNLLHTVRYYNAAALPLQVSNTVSTAFPYFTKTHVSEITTASGTAYLVMLENKKQLKIVRVVNGNLDVYEEYDKQ